MDKFLGILTKSNKRSKSKMDAELAIISQQALSLKTDPDRNSKCTPRNQFESSHTSESKEEQKRESLKALDPVVRVLNIPKTNKDQKFERNKDELIKRS